MQRIADSLIRLLTPILVHTAEEAWAAMQFKSQEVESVHLADMPKVDDSIDWRGDEERWQKLMGLRDEVMRGLEELRQEKKIASNQEASVAVYSDDEELVGILGEFGLEQFAALCIVSEMTLQKDADKTHVAAQKSTYQKCQRCWNLWPSVGADKKHPDLCKRCISVIGNRSAVENL